MPAPTRLLVIGDGNSPTGFARLLQSILVRLPSRFEVHHLAVNHRGDPHPYPWAMYPAGNQGDIYGVNRVRDLMERVRPALVWIVSDPWNLARYAEVLAPFRSSARIMCYVPIEGAPADPTLGQLARSVDRLVAYTRFGAAEITESILQSGGTPGLGGCAPIDIIPHGLDIGTFRPLGPALGDRSAAKRQILPHLPEFQDSFIVFNGNRNQPRKRVDITMKAFALFAKEKPDNVKLYLHMGVEDLGWNVKALAQRLGLENRLILTSNDSEISRATDEQLNTIYNVGDVGVSTAVGEGWGLVAFEHAATGAPQVLPRHSGYAELWEGAAEFVEPAYTLTMERSHWDGWFVTERGVADALERLYRSPELRATRGRQAFERATDPALAWDRVTRRWVELFDGLVPPVG